MELDFSEQIKNLNILSAELQTKNDYPEMEMKNKEAMKAQSFKVEIEKEEDEEEDDEDEEEGKKNKEKEDDDEDEMEEESEAAKKAKKELEEKEKEKENKFPFNKSKASLAEKVSRMLEAKINSHNEKFEQNISFAQISKVYSRGLNVFNTTHKPGISLHQWATARVNLFLKMMGGGKVKNEYLLLDADVAHASSDSFTESGLPCYDFIDFSDLEFQLAKISLLEAGINENEMNFQISESEEKKKE